MGALIVQGADVDEIAALRQRLEATADDNAELRTAIRQINEAFAQARSLMRRADWKGRTGPESAAQLRKEAESYINEAQRIAHRAGEV